MIRYKRSNPIDDISSSTKRYLQLSVLISKKSWLLILSALIVVGTVCYFFGKWRGLKKAELLAQGQGASAVSFPIMKYDRPSKDVEAQDDSNKEGD